MYSSKLYRYSLDRTSKKFYCPNPSCNKKRLVRYIDNATGLYISDQCGRCDRQEKCGYHLSPKNWFELNPNGVQPSQQFSNPSIKARPTDYISPETVSRSLKLYDNNNFILWLQSKFDKLEVDQVLQDYKIGTAKLWKGANVFWQIDERYKVRQGKVFLYDKSTGKRRKDKGCLFIGKRILKATGIEDPNLEQTFFGGHLVNSYPNKIVAIVESEKTAVLMSMYALRKQAPDYIYMATGGSSGCKWYETSVHSFLAKKHLVIIPDLGQYEKWSTKAEFIKAKSVTVLDILEKLSSDHEKYEGLDIADFYLEEHSELQQAPESKLSIESWDDIRLNNLLEQNPNLKLLIDAFDLSIDNN